MASEDTKQEVRQYQSKGFEYPHEACMVQFPDNATYNWFLSLVHLLI